jgi:uncharacterized membrane protein
MSGATCSAKPEARPTPRSSSMLSIRMVKTTGAWRPIAGSSTPPVARTSYPLTLRASRKHAKLMKQKIDFPVRLFRARTGLDTFVAFPWVHRISLAVQIRDSTPQQKKLLSERETCQCCLLTTAHAEALPAGGTARTGRSAAASSLASPNYRQGEVSAAANSALCPCPRHVYSKAAFGDWGIF